MLFFYFFYYYLVLSNIATNIFVLNRFQVTEKRKTLRAFDSFLIAFMFRSVLFNYN